MEKFKDGNTTLIFNDSKAVRTEAEIKAILDDISRDAVRDIIAAEVRKNQQNTA